MNNSTKLKEKIKEFANSKHDYVKDRILYNEILELCEKVENSDEIKMKIMEIFATRYSK